MTANKTLYEKSPLAEYILGLIQEVKDIRKKLTKKQKDIDGVMSVISTLLGLVDDTLRSFDDKQMPSKARFLWLFGKYTVVFSVKGGIAATKIDLDTLKKDHIIFLDFFKRSIDGLLKLLPDQIEELFPFVDFQKIPSFVNEGFIIDKLKKLLVKKIPCYITITDQDEIEKIKLFAPAAYFCNYKSKKLFYLNRKSDECTEIKLTSEQWKKWSEFTNKKGKTGLLEKSSLKKIQKITGHSHTGKLKYIVDHFSIDEKLKVKFEGSLTGNGLKLKKYDQSFKINDFYQFLILLVKYFKKFIKKEGNFLKGLVTFIRASKNPDVFAGANYYQAFIDAVNGDLESENDVEKLLGVSPRTNPSFLPYKPIEEAYTDDAFNHKIGDLTAVIDGCRDKMHQKEELSIDDLDSLITLLNEQISVTLKRYKRNKRNKPQNPVLQDEAFKVITEAETLRASLVTFRITLIVLDSLEEQYTYIASLIDGEEKKQKQNELALVVSNPTHIFQERYRLIQNLEGDIFIRQAILDKMDAFKLQICSERKVQPELSESTTQSSNKSEANEEKESVSQPELKLESKPEPEEANQNDAQVIPEQKEAENNSASALGYEDLKRIKIENLIEALAFYRYRIEINQDGDSNNFSYGFSFLTRAFKSRHRESNYHLAGILIKELQKTQCVSISGLFSKNNIKKLRVKPRFNCGVNSNDLNYIFKSARNTKLKELVDLPRLEKAKDDTTYSSPKKK